MDALTAYMSVYYVCVLDVKAWIKHWILGTELEDSCEPPCGCLELNPSPLEM